MRWPPLLAKTGNAVTEGLMMACYAGLKWFAWGFRSRNSINLEGVVLNWDELG